MIIFNEQYFENVIHRLNVSPDMKDAIHDYLKSLGMEPSLVSGIFEILHSTEGRLYSLDIEGITSVYETYLQTKCYYTMFAYRVLFDEGVPKVTVFDTSWGTDDDIDFLVQHLAEDIFDNFVFYPNDRDEPGDEAVVAYTLFCDLVSVIVTSPFDLSHAEDGEVYGVTVMYDTVHRALVVRPIDVLKVW